MANTTTKRDQILDNIVTTLQGITTANGYEFNMGIVDREVQIVDDTKKFPACYPIASDENPQQSDTDALMNAEWKVGLLIYVKHNTKLSKECEKVIGGIRKALLVDETRGGLAIWTTIDQIRNISTWLKPIGIYEFDMTIQYRYQKATP